MARMRPSRAGPPRRAASQAPPRPQRQPNRLPPLIEYLGRRGLVVLAHCLEPASGLELDLVTGYRPGVRDAGDHRGFDDQALARFTSCVLQSGVDLPYRAIKTNTADSLGVVVQLERRPGRRFVSEVVEINRYHPDLDEYDFGVIFQARQEEP